MTLLTVARDLQRRKARERLALFVAEGVRAAEEVVRSPITLRGALISREAADGPRIRAVRTLLESRNLPVEEVSERELASAADTETPQGILILGEIPERDPASLQIGSPARLLVLDGIQDPGNAGALLRTAAALGVNASFAMPGTVDLWNAKVVRSAMGALFRHPQFAMTWDGLDDVLAARHVELWGADAAGEPLATLRAPDRLALVLGNEGAGLSASASARVVRRVGIPIAPDSESLNVAVAAGILLHHLRP